MNIPPNLFYTESHEWILVENNNATIGITDFAQGELGDIVYLPEEGSDAVKGSAFGTIEAVKTVSDLYVPLSGRVIEINQSLDDEPELVNLDPYGEGWIFKIELSGEAQTKNLLSADEYSDIVRRGIRYPDGVMSGVYSHLESVRREKGAGYLVLIDPDSKNDGKIKSLVESVNKSGADAVLVGGSLIMDSGFGERAKKIKSLSDVPVILFPGSVSQLGPYFDAVLFMSIISGRNPTYLIGEQVIGAPIVKDLGLEAIPTGYMLFDGGSHSTVEFMSNSRPLSMNRPEIAVLTEDNRIYDMFLTEIKNIE